MEKSCKINTGHMAAGLAQKARRPFLSFIWIIFSISVC